MNDNTTLKSSIKFEWDYDFLNSSVAIVDYKIRSSNNFIRGEIKNSSNGYYYLIYTHTENSDEKCELFNTSNENEILDKFNIKIYPSYFEDIDSAKNDCENNILKLINSQKFIINSVVIDIRNTKFSKLLI